MDKDSKLITEAWYRALDRKGRKDFESAIQVMQKSRHRNGISGAPFDVYYFRDSNSVKIGIDFGGEQFAVLDMDDLAKGDITKAYRGDQYADVVRRQAGEGDFEAQAPPEM